MSLIRISPSAVTRAINKDKRMKNMMWNDRRQQLKDKNALGSCSCRSWALGHVLAAAVIDWWRRVKHTGVLLLGVWLKPDGLHVIESTRVDPVFQNQTALEIQNKPDCVLYKSDLDTE